MSPHGGPDTSLPEVRLRPDRLGAPAREATLAATKRLLGRAPLHEISVQDILGEAGISRPTFYSYFASKLDVVIELYVLVAEEVHTAVRPMYDRPEGQTPNEAIEIGIQRLAAAWVDSREVFAAAIEHRYTVAEMMAQSQERIAYFAEHLADQLDRDRAAGIAPPGPPSEALVTTLLWASDHALYIAGRGLNESIPDEWAAVESLTALWIRTLYGTEPQRG